ncbi:prephenate dehydratase domain-containing protein [Roseibium sp. RKSG952]|uniref:prephenate dehydratase domain-containing protein n=1 Tax=Roseibium sp. RKSG952 TaxID=2529384 RepID=UPI0012BC99B5|nr:prephenate dehydratase domain-containing protein [Roseibium sp. RKSG952]MTH95684.1 ACT domain-containing protein [Roseibium sp. RKSG952]
MLSARMVRPPKARNASQGWSLGLGRFVKRCNVSSASGRAEPQCGAQEKGTVCAFGSVRSEGVLMAEAGSFRALNPQTVIYHGREGAFAHIACNRAFPAVPAIACDTLFQVIAAVRAGKADAAVLPCENLLAGRVPDIHLLLPDSGLAIVGEIFIPIELHLVAPHGWELKDIRQVHSHPIALKQVQRFLATRGLAPVDASNTAAAAVQIKKTGDRTRAAVASELAAGIHGLTILERNIGDNPRNMTRFYVLAAQPVVPDVAQDNLLTSLIFEVKNTPGALVRAMSGFARQGINLTKLESYLVGGQFVATQFFCEFEGHPDVPTVRQALGELDQYTTSYSIVGVFPLDRTGARVRDDDSGSCPSPDRAPREEGRKRAISGKAATASDGP